MAGAILLVAIFMTQSALLIQAQTVLDDQQHNAEDCVQLTDERANEIKIMIQQLTDFIDELAKQHDYFDLKLVKLNIDKYNNTCDNSTILELFVNDCGKRSENYDFSGDFVAQTEAPDVANVENKVQNKEKTQELNTTLEKQTSRIKLNRKQRLNSDDKNTINDQEEGSANNNNQNETVQNTESNQNQTVSIQNNEQSNLNNKGQHDDQISSQQSTEVSSTENSVVNNQGTVIQNDKSNTNTNDSQPTVTNNQITKADSDLKTTNVEQATQNVKDTNSNTPNNDYAQNIDKLNEKTSSANNNNIEANKKTSVDNEQNIETVNQQTNGLNNQITDSQEINLEELQFIRLLKRLIRKEVIRYKTSNENTDLNLKSVNYTPLENKNIDAINYDYNLSDNEYTKPTLTNIDINDDILEFKNHIDKKRCNYDSNRPLLVHLYQNGKQRQVTVI